MKKLVIWLLVITLILPIQAQAAEHNNKEVWDVKRSVNSIYLQNRITGEVIVDAFELDNTGRFVKIDLIAYADQLNTMPHVSNDTTFTDIVVEPPESRTSISYTYDEDYNYIGLGSAIKVTSDVVGPATISYGESVSITQSFGGEISIQGTIKRAIQLGATFNWNTSVSSSAQFSVSYEIPSGRTGYIQFRPRYHVTEGTLTQYITTDSVSSVNDTFNVWGQCPVKLASGFADGIYERVLR